MPIACRTSSSRTLSLALLALPLFACSSTSTPETPPASNDAGRDTSAANDAGSTPSDDATVAEDTSAPPPGDDDDAAAPPAPDSGGPISDTDLIQKLLAMTKTCSGSSIVSAHTYQGNNGKAVDVCKLDGALYYTAKMAVDCDGKTTTHCPGTGPDKDCCYYNDTSFHNLQGEPLSAEFDPYVVIPLDFKYPGLDQDNGGNVIALIYKNQLEFAVFGDQGPTDLIGEASYKTASVLGINPSPASGGVDGDVTYIVFVGAGTQPHDIESQTEIQQLGRKLATDLVAHAP